MRYDDYESSVSSIKPNFLLSLLPTISKAITKNLISVAKKEGGHRAYGGDMGSFTYYNKTYTPQQLIVNLSSGIQ